MALKANVCVCVSPLAAWHYVEKENQIDILMQITGTAYAFGFLFVCERVKLHPRAGVFHLHMDNVNLISRPLGSVENRADAITLQTKREWRLV